LHNCERFGQLQTVRSTETLKISHRLMNNSHFARCLQGGGVAVWEGSVSIVNSQIYSNTAHNVRVCVRNSHRPDGKLTVLLVVCRAAVFVSLEAQSHSSIAKCIPTKLHMCGDSCSKAPIARWENCAPMGDSRFARCLQGGGVHVSGGTVSIVNSQIYSNTATYVRADVRNSPSPSREKWLTCLP
jgi:hypothetical protein